MCIKDRYTKQEVIDRALSTGIERTYIMTWLRITVMLSTRITNASETNVYDALTGNSCGKSQNTPRYNDPNWSCLFAAVSPTNSISSQNFRTFSTLQIAFLVSVRPMPAMILRLSASVCRRYRSWPHCQWNPNRLCRPKPRNTSSWRLMRRAVNNNNNDTTTHFCLMNDGVENTSRKISILSVWTKWNLLV